jgi:hypothetical protein
VTKPVTPQEMFELWQKMVNPGAYPLQSLMFPVLDAKEIEKKIAELEVVEHWLRANVNMVQLSVQSLQYQLALLKGGEKFQQELQGGAAPEARVPELEETNNPALWAWNMMANAGKGMMEGAAKAAQEAQREAPRAAAPRKAKKRKPPEGGA